MSQNYKNELSIVEDICKKVAHFQLAKQKSLKTIILKNDKSPVTEIDRESESMIKDALLTNFPEDSFLGEETGEQSGTNNRRWIVDPLDGTRPYIHGIPTYSTLIALEEDGEVVVGAVSFPALNEVYTASKGGGAWCNGEKISVSQTASLSDAMVSALGAVEMGESEDGQKLQNLLRKTDYIYGFMDAYSYASVASGKLDAAFGLLDNSWDRAPFAILIREAGGHFSDFNGVESIFSSNFLLSNKHLYNEIVNELKEI